MKKITYLFILFLGIAFTGCQEEKGFLFQDVTRISFSPKEAGNYEMTYSFIWGTQNRDTVYLPVSISGRVADQEDETASHEPSERDFGKPVTFGLFFLM